MVFARTKLTMEDNCFEEDPGSVEMKLVGPNTSKLYKKCYEILKSVFRVSDANIQETNFNWGKSEKGDKFSVAWWVHKDMDIYTYLFINVKISGEGNDKTGSAKISIKGLIRTEYPQDTIWQRSLFYEMLRMFWTRMFYHHRREEHAEECRHSIVLLKRSIKEFYDQLLDESGVGKTPEDG